MTFRVHTAGVESIAVRATANTVLGVAAVITGEVAVLDLLVGTTLNGSGGDGSIRRSPGGHEVA